MMLGFLLTLSFFLLAYNLFPAYPKAAIGIFLVGLVFLGNTVERVIHHFKGDDE